MTFVLLGLSVLLHDGGHTLLGPVFLTLAGLNAGVIAARVASK